VSKVTSKLQVTIPKVIAEQYAIEPGTEVYFEPAGEAVRLRLAAEPPPEGHDTEYRLRLFDEATKRLRRRQARVLAQLGVEATDRGWRREDLYDRGVSR
jgi:bifunctional DNA-binding transcriptional regulator/antitoxin component of YhaV-PrlF toxin-antitoxin module